MEKQQLIFIHGGDSFKTREAFIASLHAFELDPLREKEGRWHRNLQETLGDDFEVVRPSMPGGNCDYEAWAIWFDKYVPFLRDDVILIGHSLGANFLTTYLSENTLPVSIKSLHLVAGCAGEGDFPFPETGENIEKQVSDITIYHSHDDPVVPFTDAEKYKELLPSAKLIEFQNQGHFLQEDFPELIQEIQGK